MSVRQYDIVHQPVITTPDGLPAYGNSPHTGAGQPFTGPRGRPLIQISDMGLSSMDEAVTTVHHEIYHHQSFVLHGHGGTEEAAETYGRSMLDQFHRRTGG